MLKWIWTADQWLVDHVAQPCVNWAADQGIDRNRLAEICFISALLPGNYPLIYLLIRHPEQITAEHYWMEGSLFFIIFCFIVMVRKVFNNDSVWSRPLAFVAGHSCRVVWIIMTFWFMLSLQYYSTLWMLCLLSGIYVCSARRRPPGKKQSRSALGGATERT